MRNKKTAVERPAVKYLKYELAQRPIIDKLQLHYQKYGCGVLSFGVQSNSMPRRSITPKLPIFVVVGCHCFLQGTQLLRRHAGLTLLACCFVCVRVSLGLEIFAHQFDALPALLTCHVALNLLSVPSPFVSCG